MSFVERIKSLHTEWMNDQRSICSTDLAMLSAVEGELYRDDLSTLVDSLWEQRGFTERLKGVDKKMKEFKSLFLSLLKSAPFLFIDKQRFINAIVDPKNLIDLSVVTSKFSSNWFGSVDDLVHQNLREMPMYQWVKPQIMKLAGTSKDGRGEMFFLLFGRDSRLVPSKDGSGDLVIASVEVEVKSAGQGANIKPVGGNGGSQSKKGNGTIDTLTKELARRLNISTYIPLENRPVGNTKEQKNRRRLGEIFDFDPSTINPFTTALTQLEHVRAVDLLTWYFTSLYNDRGDVEHLVTSLHRVLGTKAATYVLAEFVLTRGSVDHDVLMALNEKTEHAVIILDNRASELSKLGCAHFNYVCLRGANSQSHPDGWISISVR